MHSGGESPHCQPPRDRLDKGFSHDLGIILPDFKTIFFFQDCIFFFSMAMADFTTSNDETSKSANPANPII